MEYINKTIQLIIVIFTISIVKSQDPAPLQYAINEELPPDTFVANIVQDATLNTLYTTEVLSILEYSITSTDPNAAQLFSISTEGILYTKVKIDRESICEYQQDCTVFLDIQIQPGMYFRIIKVNIMILDQNDNSPLFDNYISLSISEGANLGATLSLPEAEDPDSPEYGVQTYSLSSLDASDMFRLIVTDDDPKEIKLELISDLDRETQDLYVLRLTARDGGNPAHSGSATVYVHITDVNDNVADFEQDIYDISVREDVMVPSNIITVKAVDRDLGVNGEVQYAFGTQTQDDYGDIFVINSTSGVISVIQELDYETQTLYQLSVEAKDSGADAIVTSSKVKIVVQDVNDNAPEIHFPVVDGVENNEVSVPENFPMNTFVAYIKVTDSDNKTSPAGQFECAMQNDYFVFEKLFSTDYKILTKVVFDREQQSAYDVDISCADKGTPIQSTTKTLRVIISDENDFSPLFVEDVYGTSILENNPIGASVKNVQAYDNDSDENAHFRYSIEESVQPYFDIDQTGYITAKAALDRESTPRWEFTVFATDQGNPNMTGSATVVVEVMDEDDSYPTFIRSNFNMFAREAENVGISIGQVEAVDLDSEQFNKFTYTLDSSPDAVNFDINSQTGEVRTRVVLDREIKSKYEFGVFAVSTGFKQKTSSALITVYVGDINDNSPVIDFPIPNNDTVTVPSSSQKGSVVTYIQAHDTDTGENSLLKYTINSGEGNEYFTLEENTGILYVEKDLYDMAHHIFTFSILVHDSGTEPKFDEGTLHIIVNQSAPQQLPNQQIMKSNNITIVVVIACVSGVIMVILAIAIVAIVRQQRRRKVAKQQYKHMPKIEPTVTNDNKSNDYLDRVNNLNLDHTQDSIPEQDIDYLSQDYKQKDILSALDIVSGGGIIERNPEMGGSFRVEDYKPEKIHPKQRSNSDIRGDKRRRKEVSFANEAMEIEHELLRAHQMALKSPAVPDNDRDSGCSMDTSNADSGRGSTDDAPCDIHIQQNPNPSIYTIKEETPRNAPPRPPPRIHTSSLVPGRTYSKSVPQKDNSSYAKSVTQKDNSKPNMPSHRSNSDRIDKRNDNRTDKNPVIPPKLFPRSVLYNTDNRPPKSDSNPYGNSMFYTESPKEYAVKLDNHNQKEISSEVHV